MLRSSTTGRCVGPSSSMLQLLPLPPTRMADGQDALSQRSDHPRRKDDNANVTLLPSDVFEVCNMEATLVDSGGDELVECIQRSMDYDDTVVKALQELGAGMLQSDKWERDGDLVMYRGCVYVPKDPQPCHDIVHAHHDSMMTGHSGQWKTLELVSCNYWWPGISCYVASYVAGCDACNCCKSFLTQKVGKLTPNQIPTHCWEVISVSNICPYHPDPILECLLDLRPNLVLIDGSEEYEVESIVDSKYRYQHLHYLVKFKGWLDSNNEWLPADHLANAPDIVQDFHLCYPSAPTPCHT